LKEETLAGDESWELPGRLSGKVAIVTGAGSGIGRAAALRFSREGADVVCADLNRDGAEVTAAQIEAADARAVAVGVDVRDAEGCEAMATRTVEAFGRIDALFANAGISGVGSVESAGEEVWREVLDVNLIGTWLTIRSVLPSMRERGKGAIVIQSSVAALAGFPGNAPYTATKGALTALARQINAEYLSDGIRANALCPGTADTELVRRLAAEAAESSGRTAAEELKAMGDWYPIGRLASPDEIAAAAAFLASDDSSYVCGTELVVDGGLLTAPLP
jgi:NAD(P)-dependent dehydrogenase (short-subunit alcohol dehydrogenase family)